MDCVNGLLVDNIKSFSLNIAAYRCKSMNHEVVTCAFKVSEDETIISSKSKAMHSCSITHDFDEN